MTFNINFLRDTITEMIFLMTHIMNDPSKEENGSSFRADYIGLSKRFYDLLTKENPTPDETKVFEADKEKLLKNLIEFESSDFEHGDLEDIISLELEVEKRKFRRRLVAEYDLEASIEREKANYRDELLDAEELT